MLRPKPTLAAPLLGEQLLLAEAESSQTQERSHQSHADGLRYFTDELLRSIAREGPFRY